jgi:hypothetical protein
MQANIPAVAIKYHEMVEQGFISGWCYSADTGTKF